MGECMNYYKQSITDACVKGKKVLVRCDLNTPQDEQGNVTDPTRIITAVPTIKYLAEQGAKVVICSHLGRPKGKVVPEFSLTPIAKETEKYVCLPVKMASDIVGESAHAILDSLKEGEIMMLENVRFDPREEKNDPEFSKQLAEFGDLYVNEAFGTAHRAHCSTEGVAKYIPGYAGFLMQKELDTIGQALSDPKRPFVAILGGSKVSDKIMAIENLLPKCDALLIGGAMAYTFAKAKGGKIGKSLCEEDRLEVARNMLNKAENMGVKLYLPIDHIAAASFSPDADFIVIDGDKIPDDHMALDIGPKTAKLYASVIKTAKTVVWNGPMGVFEFDNFAAGTFAIAKAMAKNPGLTVIGGGDSVAAIKKAGLEDKISHISTGGGASLKMLEGAELPGMACLLDK